MQNLIVLLRTAAVSEEWKLDNQQTSHDEVSDSVRLALCNYELTVALEENTDITLTQVQIVEPYNCYM